MSVHSKYNDLQTSYNRVTQELGRLKIIQAETNNRFESDNLMLTYAKNQLEQKCTGYERQILEQNNATRVIIANQKEKIMNLMTCQSKLHYYFNDIKRYIQCALDNFNNGLKNAQKSINEAIFVDKSVNQRRVKDIQLQYREKYKAESEEIKSKHLKEIENLQEQYQLKENEMIQCFQSRKEKDFSKIRNEARKELDRVESERSSLEQKLEEAIKDMDNFRTKCETIIANMGQQEKKIQLEKQEYINENALLQRKNKDIEKSIAEKDVKIEQLRRIITDLDSDISLLKAKNDETTQKCDDMIKCIKIEHTREIEKIKTLTDDLIEREKVNQKQLTEKALQKVKDEFEKTLNGVSKRHIEEKSTLLIQSREEKNIYEKNLILKETEYEKREIQFQEKILTQQKRHDKDKADLLTCLEEKYNKQIEVIEKAHEENMLEKEKMITCEKQKYERIMEERLSRKIIELSATTESKRNNLDLNYKRIISEMEQSLIARYENNLRQNQGKWDEERDRLKKEIDELYSKQQRLIENHNAAQCSLEKKEAELVHLRNTVSLYQFVSEKNYVFITNSSLSRNQ